jgi:hypothetical protein
MKQTLIVKVAIGICVLVIFPPISMLTLLLIDRALMKGIRAKETSANNIYE